MELRVAGYAVKYVNAFQNLSQFLLIYCHPINVVYPQLDFYTAADDIVKYLEAVWIQMRRRVTRRLIWDQTACHRDSICVTKNNMPRTLRCKTGEKTSRRHLLHV